MTNSAVKVTVFSVFVVYETGFFFFAEFGKFPFFVYVWAAGYVLFTNLAKFQNVIISLRRSVGAEITARALSVTLIFLI